MFPRLHQIIKSYPAKQKDEQIATNKFKTAHASSKLRHRIN